ncbi:MAG TPA: glycogen/starch synthase [Candidatus Limnocylindrales bacterium]|nr:glycogen/starch synthase [Candidatus Limnocylindrales bacterium]
MRVAFIAAECDPWAKVGGLGDAVDGLARAVGRVVPAPGDPLEPVDVYLPRYRQVAVPAGATARTLPVADPLAPNGGTTIRLLDVRARGYRLRLVDHPPAFDRPGVYGEGATDYPDNAWRFGLLCRAALAAIRGDAEAGERAVDVLHLHDWHAVPALAVVTEDVVDKREPRETV